jgi:hypothetical protein
MPQVHHFDGKVDQRYSFTKGRFGHAMDTIEVKFCDESIGYFEYNDSGANAAQYEAEKHAVKRLCAIYGVKL